MKVELIDYTKNAEDLLIFCKRKRRSDSEIKDMTDKEKQQELDYILNTISGPWEFIDYVFHISDVTRAFTHQLVRHRVGTSYSQESLRITDKSRLTWKSIKGCTGEDSIMFLEIEEMYNELRAKGVDTQDARGILPINTLTNITVKINLRALNSMMNTRLCVRTAGEFQEVAKLIRSLIIEVHPWAEKALLPFCMEWGVCKFQNYDNCPIKKAHPWLQKNESDLSSAKQSWERVVGTSRQPE